MNKKIIFAVLLLGLILAGAAYFSYSPTPAEAQGPGPVELTGWAWSSNIGWVSMNCSSPGAGGCSTGGNYGVTVDGSNLGGWAWSSNIGWIDFSPDSGYPTGNGTVAAAARIKSDGSGLEGWARACSVFVFGCAGTLKPAEARGGWDGWISLAGTATGGSGDRAYGVTRSLTSDGGYRYNGYAWGSLVVGWLSFGADQTPGGGGPCNPQVETCGGGGDALSLNCTVSNASPNVGDTVTWRAEASGGSGSAPRVLCWGSGCTNPPLDPVGDVPGGNVEQVELTVSGPVGREYVGRVRVSKAGNTSVTATCSTVTVQPPTCPTFDQCAVDGTVSSESLPEGYNTCTQAGVPDGTVITHTCRPNPVTYPSCGDVTRAETCSADEPRLEPVINADTTRIVSQTNSPVTSSPSAQFKAVHGNVNDIVIDRIVSATSDPSYNLLSEVEAETGQPVICYMRQGSSGAYSSGRCDGTDGWSIDLSEGEIGYFAIKMPRYNARARGHTPYFIYLKGRSDSGNEAGMNNSSPLIFEYIPDGGDCEGPACGR